MSASTGNRVGRRATQAVTRSFASRLAGRSRGSDWRADKRCSPRAESFDVDDPRANVWRKIEDGTKAGGMAFIDAIYRAAVEWNRHERMQAEGERRAAGVRTAAEAKEAGLPPPRWQGPLGQHTLRVLEAVLRGHWFDFRTGRLDPAMTQLEKATGFKRQTIVNALRRLRESGFLLRVRRTIEVTEDDGDRRRVQTNNAYYFDMAGLPRNVVMRIRQLLERARRKRPPPAPPAADPAPKAAQPQNSGLRDALAALGRTLDGPSPSQ